MLNDLTAALVKGARTVEMRWFSPPQITADVVIVNFPDALAAAMVSLAYVVTLTPGGVPIAALTQPDASPLQTVSGRTAMASGNTVQFGVGLNPGARETFQTYAAYDTYFGYVVDVASVGQPVMVHLPQPYPVIGAKQLRINHSAADPADIYQQQQFGILVWR